MSMVAEKEVSREVKPAYILGPSTRCDSCSAEALVLIKGVAGELMFCGHHYTKNEEALKEFAYEVIDERAKLIQDRIKDEDYV